MWAAYTRGLKLELACSFVAGIGISALIFVVQYARAKTTRRILHGSNVIRGEYLTPYLVMLHPALHPCILPCNLTPWEQRHSWPGPLARGVLNCVCPFKAYGHFQTTTHTHISNVAFGSMVVLWKCACAVSSDFLYPWILQG